MQTLNKSIKLIKLNKGLKIKHFICTFFNICTFMEFKHRIAKLDDIPNIEGLMLQSITKLLGYYVDEEELEASFESMGLDDQLIKDKTYFLIFHGEILVKTLKFDQFHAEIWDRILVEIRLCDL